MAQRAEGFSPSAGNTESTWSNRRQMQKKFIFLFCTQLPLYFCEEMKNHFYLCWLYMMINYKAIKLDLEFNCRW